jgi:hypothetical protein
MTGRSFTLFFASLITRLPNDAEAPTVISQVAMAFFVVTTLLSTASWLVCDKSRGGAIRRQRTQAPLLAPLPFALTQ